MAIQSFENNLLIYEQILQDKFKVKNPYLLKTGTLATIINILAYNKYDTFDYYNQVFQESTPALAKDFNSMLFHSTFYGVEIEMAKPAVFSVYLQIPQINTDNIESYEYIIPKNTAFTTTEGLPLIIENEIQIIQSDSKIKAYSFIDNAKTELNIITTKDDNGNIIYLIQYDYVYQYKRLFYKNVIPSYEFGTNYIFDIGIDSYKNIYKINSWLNENPLNTVDLNLLYKYDTNNIQYSFNFTPLNIKYYDFNSTRYDYDIFLDIQINNLIFKVGSGINGKYINEGSEIYTELKLTQGEDGNLENIEFNIPDIIVITTNINGIKETFKSNINGFSISSGSGGCLVEDIESIRSKIFNKIKTRNGIVTLSDFENYFTLNGIKPFIDSKFINGSNVIFIFNALKYKNELVNTTSKNLPELTISNNPFYPVIIIDDKEYISPFYYKKLNNNITQAFSIDSNIDIPLFSSLSSDDEVLLEYKVKLSLIYDFKTKKSYLKLDNYQNDFIYKLSCNLFNCEFNYGNNFTYEINTRYTDTYCIVNDYLYNFRLDVVNPDGVTVLKLFNYKSKDRMYYQLKLRQEIYKFYLETKEDYPDIEEQETTATLAYLDNDYADIMNTVESLYEPVKGGNIPYLLRLPFIDKDFYDKVDYQEFYSILEQFFTIGTNQNNFSLTSRIQQCFYNTIKIEDKYQPYLFEQNNIIIPSPKIPIQLDILIDSMELYLSKYDTQYDLEFDLKLKITEFLTTKEGFEISFYESELEDYLYNYFNSDKKVLKNIDIKTPKMFIVNNAEDIYYNMIQDLSIFETLEFIPPYFYYDYNNILINTKII